MALLIGHEKQTRIFLRSLGQETLHHAWILAGPKGLGKSGFAKKAALHLLNTLENNPTTANEFYSNPESQAERLVNAGAHPDFRFLQRAIKNEKEHKKLPETRTGTTDEHELKRNISIDQVRSLQSLFATQPSISRYRVVIIDAIDDLEGGGANALLKNLEEPPKDTIFLLVSHTPERLLPTIRSRCQMLRFEPLNAQNMMVALKQLMPQANQQEINALISVSNGSPGKAISYRDVGLADMEKLAQSIMASGDEDNLIRSSLARKLSLKPAALRYYAFLALAPQLIAIKIREDRNLLNNGTIELWQEASKLAAAALPKSLDPQAVIFRMCGLLSALAQSPKAA